MADSLLSVAEAQRIILEAVVPRPAVAQRLGPELLGLATAEDVAADRDSPPFDKALMDGYAVRSADLAGGSAELHVIEEVLAGQVPRHDVDPGQATRIMTGAPLPKGADAVVMIERSTPLDDHRVRLNDAIQPARNVLHQGQEMRAGEVVVPSGTRLRPEVIGLLAAVGKGRIAVHPRPVVACVPTGDEVVEVDKTPGPGQIRNSNGQMLLAQIARAGAEPRGIGIARDEPSHLRQLIEDGLRSDVLVLSGGVSAGKVDLVPRILAECGVDIVLHKVRMKPGKPMLFGRKGDRCVFGLPGNPVSSLVCFELFVRPTIRRLMGLPPGPFLVQAALAQPFELKTDRPTYFPAMLEESSTGRSVRLVRWLGSADLRGLLAGNAFACFAEGVHTLQAGAMLPVLVMD